MTSEEWVKVRDGLIQVKNESLMDVERLTLYIEVIDKKIMEMEENGE